jgi:hypothetical protein
VDYAFLLAALIALVDLLPILGVGTVLIPWSVVMLLQHRFFIGFGLLVLYLAVTVVRQIAEPRLLGKSLGLHPLLTVFSTYVGWELFGFFGMLLGPFFVLLAISQNLLMCIRSQKSSFKSGWDKIPEKSWMLMWMFPNSENVCKNELKGRLFSIQITPLLLNFNTKVSFVQVIISNL